MLIQTNEHLERPQAELNKLLQQNFSDWKKNGQINLNLWLNADREINSSIPFSSFEQNIPCIFK